MRVWVRWVLRRIFVLNRYFRFIGDVQDRLPGAGFEEVGRSGWGHNDILAKRDERWWGFICRPGELSAISVRDIGANLMAAMTAEPGFGYHVHILVCDQRQVNSAHQAAKAGRMRIVVLDRGFEQAMREIAP